MTSSIHFETLERPSLMTTFAYGILALYGIRRLLEFFGIPKFSARETFWNTLVHIVPARLLLGQAQRRELQANQILSQKHAAKSDALRKLIGIGGEATIQSIGGPGETIGMSRITAGVGSGSAVVTSEVPAGLGNWDNSCYQNSVLQALTSLDSLRAWLESSGPREFERASTTNTALQDMIFRLRDPTNNGSHVWTTARLKNMSSWQQQDAQEYFSKVMDELDKEAVATTSARTSKPGLEASFQRPQMLQGNQGEGNLGYNAPRNPLEGLVAQRVACTRCGFSEGYTMIPFNCLTVPLGSNLEHYLEDCLDDYTQSENIEGVECRSCTLIHAEQKLHQLQLPAELRVEIAHRILAIQTALAKDDFSDRTLKQDCQIPAKAYLSSTKTREAVVGRAPQSLAIHINRSLFDETIGVQRKNYAQVRYPLLLDLKRWVLGMGDGSYMYKLRAIVTHYGRHENGHYICYRKHPSTEPLKNLTFATVLAEEDEPQGSWWRLSDEDVSPVTEQDVLDQGGVFMLFYERIKRSSDEVAMNKTEEAAAVPLPPDEDAEWGMMSAEPSITATPSLVTSSVQSVVSDDTDAEPDVFEGNTIPRVENKVVPQASLLKTASPAYFEMREQDLNHELTMNRHLMSV